MTKEKSKKGTLQRLWNIIKGFVNFLRRPYVWSGLLAGFLWSFLTPFILNAFASAFLNVPQEAIWVFFFPLKSAFYILYGETVGPEGYVDPLFLWMFSVIIGMIIGVAITYSIHRIRILLKR